MEGIINKLIVNLEYELYEVKRHIENIERYVEELKLWIRS